MAKYLLLLALFAATMFAAPAATARTPRTGDTAETVRFRGVDYDVFATSRPEAVRLYWKAPSGRRFAFLGAVVAYAKTLKTPLAFAANAGMYTPSGSPAGLYVEAGRELHSLNRKNGYGNFHLKPNGVFFIANGEAGVLQTSEYVRKRPAPRLATQSGPMLVVNGRLHPRFFASSPSKHIRNGVGVDAKGRIVFAISGRPVNFYDFARLFKDRLGCRNALYLDGSVSRTWLPALKRFDLGGDLGPIIGVVE